jgi:hypothetical protein
MDRSDRIGRAYPGRQAIQAAGRHASVLSRRTLPAVVP